MIEYVWLIPLMPLLAALACGVAGRRLGENAGTVAIAGMFTTLMLTARLLFIDVPAARIAGELPFRVTLFPWMEVGGFTANFGFLVDEVTVVMLLIVSLVGSFVFYYAAGYMHGDAGYPRFFAYLSLFAFAMYILVLADNLLLLFVGWEGVGLCSYLLIGFWFKNRDYASAGKKAFIVNRIGDFGFILATFFALWGLGTLDFIELRHVAEGVAATSGNEGIFAAICLCFFVAATGKSAQIPLYIWLPDAMAGPTPVSALIHAATMVTAGIYLIVRLGFLFVLSPMTLTLIATIGVMTALMAALIAVTQHDIKKVLAYSTVSQLGYMFLALGVGAFGPALFHVFTHAFFKGCLFLCAGSVIHAMHHEQDMRKMGGLKRKMPVTSAAYFISTLAIAGIPPLAGFFSKDEILWSVLSSGVYGWLLWSVGIVTAGLTSFYMFRSYYMTFEGEPRISEYNFKHVHESPARMTRPLMVLAFGAAVMGLLGLPAWLAHLFDDSKAQIFHHYLAPALPHAAHGAHHVAMEVVFALVSVAVASLGWWRAKALYGGAKPVGDEVVERAFPVLYRHAAAKFSVDELYGRAVVAPMYRGADAATAADKNIIDGWIERIVEAGRLAAAMLRRLQTGHAQVYAASIVIGLNVFLLLYWIA